MSPGHLPGVFQALVGDPGAEPKHTGIMYNHLSKEWLRVPWENCVGCDLNKEHLDYFAEPAAATIRRWTCLEKSADGWTVTQ